MSAHGHAHAPTREEVRQQLTFHTVDTLDEVFDIALLPPDRPVHTRKTVMEEMEEAAAAR